MVVEAVTTRTFETSNGNRLVTWNKLRILETISSPEEAVNDIGLLAHGDTGISSVAANGHLVPFREGFEQGDTLEALKNNLKARH